MLKTNVKFFLGIQFALWTALAVISRLSWLGFESEPPGWDRLTAYSVFGFLYSTGLGALFTRMYDWPVVRQVFSAAVLTIIAALLWRVSYNAFEFHILESGNEAFFFWGYLHWGRTSATQMLVWSGIFWALHYYSSYTQQKLQAAAAKAQAQNAKLLLLQYQVNPHFLFNTLSGVDTLLLKNDVASARKMLSLLSDFMRQTLERDPAPSVLLGTEIERIEAYLDIEKVRAGDRLAVEWELQEPLPDALLPNGILLPLVENALKHGAINSRVGGFLRIAVGADKSHLTVRLENDTKAGREPGFGIGLSNTRERLETIYDGRATFVAGAKDGLYSVTMKVPLEEGASANDN